MRASEPTTVGKLDRGGVTIAYEVHGSGDLTLLMVPPAPITHSRIFKAQVPYLSRHYRVITFDARGNGQSSWPSDPESHSRAENVADMLAVLDATSTDAAILVAHCHANWWAVEFADDHPDKVMGLVAIEPGVPYLGTPQPHWLETGPHWDDELDDPQGWELNNKHVYINQYRRWLEWFFWATAGRISFDETIRGRYRLGPRIHRLCAGGRRRRGRTRPALSARQFLRKPVTRS